MKEIRNLAPELTEVRTQGESKRQVVGYAAVFDSFSIPISAQGGFTEVIKPGAFDGVIKRSDVLALLDHQKNRGVLARRRLDVGTLDLSVDNKGLRFEFEAPNTNLGNEVIEGIERRDITNASFAFTIPIGGDSWERRSDGTYLRTINQIDKIYDVSPVYSTEAYEDTTVALRSLEEFRSQEDVVPPVVPPVAAPVVEKPSLDELTRYYNILEDKMKNVLK